MSERDARLALQHMLDYAREAVDLAEEKNRRSFGQDRVLQLALTRLVEIIGEAATRVSEKTRKQNPKIPWPQIIGMRNRLIHGYDMLDANLLWDTVEQDLPELIRQLESLLE